MTKDGLFSMLVIGVVVAALLAVMLRSPPEHSYLVGYGCEGSDGKTLVGREEDDFPPCSKIERVQ